MNLNLSKIITFFILIILIFSCKKYNKTSERTLRDRLIATEEDTLYKREWMRINFENRKVEEVEIYISENNDTISNQYKLFINNNIDTLKSNYYDLILTKTNKPNVYKGQITLHTKYENLKLNKQNRRRIQFSYCDQNKDSIFIRYVESKSSNIINFKFENYYGNRLQGQLYQIVERDTIVNNEEMININQSYIMVDNQIETVNLFLDSDYIEENKFNPGKLKFTKNK
ncbi:hypothetical protein [Flavobacterium sp.]|uniref:hypothetical protein n=1 Tax=Flavobacterium sp. TaxID=239 RepID=UPI003D29C871